MAYASRTLTMTDRRCCVIREELLALVYFVKYFRHYLVGKKLRVRTDQVSVCWMMQLKSPEGQVAFDIEIIHHPGRLHTMQTGLAEEFADTGKFDETEKEFQAIVCQTTTKSTTTPKIVKLCQAQDKALAVSQVKGSIKSSC